MMKARILVLCISALATVGALAAVVITGLDTLEEPEGMVVPSERAAAIPETAAHDASFTVWPDPMESDTGPNYQVAPTLPDQDVDATYRASNRETQEARAPTPDHPGNTGRMQTIDANETRVAATRDAWEGMATAAARSTADPTPTVPPSPRPTNTPWWLTPPAQTHSPT